MEITIEGKRYRSVSLDEWMMQLQKDHPARQELIDLRLKLAGLTAKVSELEAENASLNQKINQHAQSAGNQTYLEAGPAFPTQSFGDTPDLLQ